MRLCGHSVLRDKLPAVLLSLGLLGGVAGCDTSETVAAEPNGQTDTATTADADAPAPAAGTFSGKALDSQGKPLATFGGTMSGFSLKSGENVSAEFDGSNGTYRGMVGPGNFSIRAWTDVTYNGRKYRFDLHPTDDKSILKRYDTTDGVRRDFDWKLSGLRPDGDDSADPRFYDWYGGCIVLTNGDDEWQRAVDANLDITVRLEPEGPLVDGTEGKPLDFKVKFADMKRMIDRHLTGLPVGKYKVSVSASDAGGAAVPVAILLKSEDAGRSTPEPTSAAPGGSATLEFVQQEISTNINRVMPVNLYIFTP